MISTDLRPSRPSTAGSRPVSIACEEVDELVAVADVGDAARVAGAGLEAGLAGHGGVDFVVAGHFLLEVPEREVVLLDPRRAAVAVDLGPLQQAGIGTRGRFDHAERTVLEPQGGDGRVLDLDPLVGQRARSAP